MGYLEPPRVYVDHIRGNLVLTQLLRDVPNLVFGGVGIAAHPQPERPKRQHLSAPSKGRVLREDLLGVPPTAKQLQPPLRENTQSRNPHAAPYTAWSSTGSRTLGVW